MSPEFYPLDFKALSKLPIIDGHLHVWKGYQPDQIWDTLKLSGVQRCNALSLNNFEAGGTLNEEALYFKKASNGLAYAFGSLDYSVHLQGGGMYPEDLVLQAGQLKALGYDGIKMWEGKPLAYITLPEPLDGGFFDPFFAWVEENGFPIILHLADAPRFWDPTRKGLDPWSFADEPFPSRQKMYAELENILDRHPELKLILAHFLFLWDELDEARRILDAHPAIAFDLTPGVQGYVQMSREVAAARQFFLDYQDRLIYGTDIGALPLLNSEIEFIPGREAMQPWLVRSFLEMEWDIPFPEQVGITKNAFAGERLGGLALPTSALEKIYRLNFERLVGSTPVKI